MSGISIIYWSGTGNTEAMAKAIKEGIESDGGNVLLKSVDEARLDDIKDAKAIVLGSPSMGAEELAEEMEPFVSQMENEGVKDKVAGAFGSYDWGDGQWMVVGDEHTLHGDGFILSSIDGIHWDHVHHRYLFRARSFHCSHGWLGHL